MKKRKHVKKTEITSKLRIDRFFEVCRNQYNIYAFQNESKLKMEFLNKMSFPSLVTSKPKKSFFIDDNTLVDDGFIIYFKNFDEETFQKIKQEMIKIFKASFFIKTVKNDLRNKEDKKFFDGQFIIKNFKLSNTFKE